MGTKKFDVFSKKFEIEFNLYFDLCWRAEIIQVGLNMHLYVDIGDALSSLWGSTSSYWFVDPQSVCSCPSFSARQSLYARQGVTTSCSHGGVRHLRGIHSHSNPSQPSLLTCLLLKPPTVLFSGSSLRSQMCHRTYSPESWTGLSAHSASRGSMYWPMGRHCSMAKLTTSSPTACSPDNSQTLCHGVSGQAHQIPPGASSNSPMVRHSLAPPNWTLAGVTGHSGEDPIDYWRSIIYLLATGSDMKDI